MTDPIYLFTLKCALLLQILQITKILNAHMDSLQWIDNNTGNKDILWSLLLLSFGRLTLSKTTDSRLF